MAYQENLEVYLSLSRRELQGLCKENNLPANRSHTELAKSLVSLFKKNNASLAPSKERLSTPLESLYSKTYVLDTGSKETTNPSEDNTKVSDSHKVASCMKEKGGDHRRHALTGSQMEISSHMGGQAVENAYNFTSNAIFPNAEVAQVFDLTTSGGKNRSPGTEGRLSSKCNVHGTNSGVHKLSDLNKFGQKLLNRSASNRKIHKSASAQNTHPGADCHSKSGLTPKGNITEATPSFQFFVESDDGFHLYVDLNARSSEWVSGLKDGVSESLKSQHHKPRTLPNHFENFTAMDGSSKISTLENIRVTHQSNGDRNSGCTASTLSSISDICQSEGSLPDATVMSAESSVLTSNSLPVEMSGCLNGNQVISSSCATQSNAQECLPFDTTSSPENSNSSHHNLSDISSKMDECGTLQLDGLVQPIGSTGVLSPETTKVPRKLECPTPSNTFVGFNSAEANTSEKDNTNTDNLKIGNGTCLVSKQSGPKEGSSEVIGNHSRSPSACQLGRQLILDCAVTEVQSDIGSAGPLLNLHACILGDSIRKDPVAALSDELDKKTPVKEIENLPDNNSKRSDSSEFHEKFQNKKHRSNNGNTNRMVMKLRSVRTSAKETTSGRVLRPRRSTRLLTE